jgi:uncharacterized protein (DUF1697 family)
MKQVAFLRAVNVGGHNKVSVAAIAKKLGYQNIGAAGTLIAPKGSAGDVRAAIAKELGFETEIMVVNRPKLLALVEKAPLAKVTGRPFVAVLAKAPAKKPKLPVEDGKGSRLVAIDGPFALAVVLPDAKPGTTVTGLVEKALGVPATVRGWPTMEKVAKALRE